MTLGSCRAGHIPPQMERAGETESQTGCNRLLTEASGTVPGGVVSLARSSGEYGARLAGGFDKVAQGGLGLGITA